MGGECTDNNVILNLQSLVARVYNQQAADLTYNP